MLFGMLKVQETNMERGIMPAKAVLGRELPMEWSILLQQELLIIVMHSAEESKGV